MATAAAAILPVAIGAGEKLRRLVIFTRETDRSTAGEQS